MLLYDQNLEELGTLTFQRLVDDSEYNQLKKNTQIINSLDTRNQGKNITGNITKTE